MFLMLCNGIFYSFYPPWKDCLSFKNYIAKRLHKIAEFIYNNKKDLDCLYNICIIAIKVQADGLSEFYILHAIGGKLS